MIKRDDGLPAISSTNIFSALESRRRRSSKKRSDKEKADSKNKEAQQQETATTLVWTPTPVSVASWADCEEDDDDYFAMPALPPIVDQPSDAAPDAVQEDLSQESDGDEEIEDADEENEEEEPETEATEVAVDVKVALVLPIAREPDRQLSKKELKKKELAELDAVLAELGLNQKDEKDSTEPAEVNEEHGNGEVNGQLENLGSGAVLTESKSSKRRKAKKEKPAKDGKDEEDTLELDAVSKEYAFAEDGEVNSGPADRKEVLKKIASMKKKKSFKEGDGAAKAAAAEAAARTAKLAAAKKKEKNHYNQQPVR